MENIKLGYVHVPIHAYIHTNNSNNSTNSNTIQQTKEEAGCAVAIFLILTISFIVFLIRMTKKYRL